jgi:hypothetical protein
MLFGFHVLKIFYSVWFSIRLTLSVLGEDYSRNVSCLLTWISTFLLPRGNHKLKIEEGQTMQ